MNFTPSPYSRKLPHFDVGQEYYHLVFRLAEGYLTETEIEIVRELIVSGNSKFYRLIAVQVMSNHVHILLQPSLGYTLARIMGGIKGVSAHKLNISRGTKGTIWLDKYFDRIIRNQDDFEKTLRYLEQNPIKADASEEAWKYLGWQFLQE